jgi:hypothetical protein
MTVFVTYFTKQAYLAMLDFVLLVYPVIDGPTKQVVPKRRHNAENPYVNCKCKHAFGVL